jgi:hypothetical protein
MPEKNRIASETIRKSNTWWLPVVLVAVTVVTERLGDRSEAGLMTPSHQQHCGGIQVFVV